VESGVSQPVLSLGYAALHPGYLLDPILFQSEARPMGPHAEAWLAAYRTTPEGHGFTGVTGVTPALRNVLGIRSAVGAVV